MVSTVITNSNTSMVTIYYVVCHVPSKARSQITGTLSRESSLERETDLQSSPSFAVLHTSSSPAST
jgi:hypothetical protein